MTGAHVIHISKSQSVPAAAASTDISHNRTNLDRFAFCIRAHNARRLRWCRQINTTTRRDSVIFVVVFIITTITVILSNEIYVFVPRLERGVHVSVVVLESKRTRLRVKRRHCCCEEFILHRRPKNANALADSRVFQLCERRAHVTVSR